MKLTKEQREWLLIPKALPSSTHGDNLRKILPRSKWDKIRKATYQRANFKCELCSGKGSRHPVEAHEIWLFDFTTKTQYLERLVALCPNCHRIQHALLLKLQDDRGFINAEAVIRHYNKISQQRVTYSQFFASATEVFDVFDGIMWDVVVEKTNDPILLSIEF
ncbi:MAG: HNH endonuclease [Mycoplasmatales bacterium]|nr:HNH endonuclease [Mycoplasmatales bacterium]